MQPHEFVVREIEEDPSIGLMTKAMYIKNEPEWSGVYQLSEHIDKDLYE